MASLSNINGLFDVHSTGAILFSTSHGTSGQILKSNGNAAPTWVAASTVIGGPYLPLTGGTLTGPLSGTSATFSAEVRGQSFYDGYVTWTAAQFNRYGAAIELQYTPTNAATLVKIGANGSNPTIFNAFTGDATFAGTVSGTGYSGPGQGLDNLLSLGWTRELPKSC